MAVTTAGSQLEALREELAPVFPKSWDHYKRARTMIPGGNARWRFYFPFLIQIERGKGSRLWDLDGREYVDCVGAFGPMLLGHCHPEVVAAVSDQAARGLTFGAPSVIEAELAERVLTHVPGAEQVLMLVTGNEANLAAVRLARAASGKQKIAKFTGGFHGLHDYFMQSVYGDIEGDPANLSAIADLPGSLELVSESTVVLPYNDPSAFDRLRREADQVACVVLELVQGASGCLPADREFVHELRAICDECGVLLVIDEVMTGFRFGLSGASGLYGIRGDLVTLGKVLGGGYPASAVAGRRDILALTTGEPSAIVAGTYAATATAMAAGKATLDVLIREEQTIYPKLFALGERMRSGLQLVSDEIGWGYVTGAGPMWGYSPVSEKPASATELRHLEKNRDAGKALSALLLREGVFVSAPMQRGFISAAHTEEDIDYVIAAHRVALLELKERGFIA